jgi:hypothetical protein
MAQTNIKYREEVEYIDGYKVTNIYPILTKEEKQKREEEILLKLYYSFTKDNDT